MADGELIAYSIASFLCALFVLEWGADKFIDHTAIVARRTGVPQTVIALLTAGAEWEELAVVVFAIIQHRPSLALGNIVGSSISNILGAFSLGLLFHDASDGSMVFDRTAKIYTILQLVLTLLVTGLLVFETYLRLEVAGSLLIATFSLYFVSVLWAIQQGHVPAPALSDSEDIDDSDDEEFRTGAVEGISDTNAADQSYGTFAPSSNGNERPNSSASAANFSGNPLRPSSSSQSLSSSASVGDLQDDRARSSASRSSTSLLARHGQAHQPNIRQMSLTYHLAYLFLGFCGLTLSAFVLSHAATTLVIQLGISDVLFGIIILSIATTLPEKFIAIASGARGHAGIVVANTVGSNTFLLTLCMGILWLSIGDAPATQSVNRLELGVLFGSSLFMTMIVCFGGGRMRYAGAVLLAAYLAFIVIEFAILRRPSKRP